MRLPKLAWWKWLLIAYLGLIVIRNIPPMLQLLQLGQGSSIVAAVEPQLIRHLQQLPDDSPLVCEPVHLPSLQAPLAERLR